MLASLVIEYYGTHSFHSIAQTFMRKKTSQHRLFVGDKLAARIDYANQPVYHVSCVHNV